jgi:S1-C subfamily serine protease
MNVVPMNVKVVKPLVGLFILVLMVGLACNASTPATPTPGSSDLPANTQPPAEATPTTAPEPTQQSAISELRDVRKAVIQIEAQGTFIDPQFGLVLNGAGRGTGFIIDPEGIAVTNNHVVTGAALLKVWIGGETQPRNARVLGVSECSDLAVIDIDGSGFDYLEWYTGPIEPAMDIYVAGFPLGDPEYSITRGVISKARANGKTQWASVESVVEYDASTNPGNSGGPVITPNGQVLAVHFAGYASARQAFGISRDTAIKVVETLRQGKNVDSIGVNGQAIWTEDGSLTGIWVASVASGSPADRSGIKAGDIITMMENLVLATDYSMSDYCDILRSHSPEDTLGLEILRWDQGQVLEGQLNGRALTVSYAWDPNEGGTSSPDPTSPSTSGDYLDLNASASGDVIFFSDFDYGLDDWGYFLTQGDESGVALGTERGTLRFDITTKDTYVYLLYEGVEVDNVRLDVQAENLGRNNNNVSLICRYSDTEGWYEFNIANNGLYWIYLYDNTSGYVELAKGGSNRINMGQGVNEYTAVCKNTELTLYINGVETKKVDTARLTHRRLRSGLTGISVSSFNVTPIVVEMDYFALTIP